MASCNAGNAAPAKPGRKWRKLPGMAAQSLPAQPWLGAVAGQTKTNHRVCDRRSDNKPDQSPSPAPPTLWQGLQKLCNHRAWADNETATTLHHRLGHTGRAIGNGNNTSASNIAARRAQRPKNNGCYPRPATVRATRSSPARNARHPLQPTQDARQRCCRRSPHAARAQRTGA